MSISVSGQGSGTALRVVVVGGGIGGLAAGAFLHRAGIDVTVYEQAPQLGQVGAGLVVSPNAVRLLRRLGHLDRFLDAAVELEVAWEFRRWQDGEVISAEQMRGRCEQLYGESSYVCHRADLLEAIRAAVPPELIRLGMKCTGIEELTDAVRVRFDDGTAIEADVVVGADGVHSTVRGSVTTPAPATYSGMCAYRALVPAENAPEFSRRPVQTLWIGPDHHLVHYPVSGGRNINIVAFGPAGDFTDESWSSQGTVAELLAEFDGWDPRLRELIEHAGTPGRWALLDRAPLPRWSNGRITLLGDAAHPMFPFFAQGAVQAIEDAAALAQCLAAESDPARSLAVYERIRIPRAGRLQQLSHDRKDINHLPDGPEQRQRDAELGKGDALVRSGWIYQYDAETAAKEALTRC
ncbi:FAD-dependent monooxygenase [Nocardia sp. NPDC127606]|uniref:FAD-dependent monooxygenase n=1 Tax=Nocardia sp. NPDC127606 TaxID=3345406 RepID=UPI00364567F8